MSFCGGNLGALSNTFLVWPKLSVRALHRKARCPGKENKPKAAQGMGYKVRARSGDAVPGLG